MSVLVVILNRRCAKLHIVVGLFGGWVTGLHHSFGLSAVPPLPSQRCEGLEESVGCELAASYLMSDDVPLLIPKLGPTVHYARRALYDIAPCPPHLFFEATAIPSPFSVPTARVLSLSLGLLYSFRLTRCNS